MMKIVKSVILSIIFTATAVAALNANELNLTVRTEEGVPVKGAELELSSEEGAGLSSGIGLITSDKGRIKLRSLESGNYEVFMSVAGLMPLKTNFNIKGDTHITLTLKPMVYYVKMKVKTKSGDNILPNTKVVISNTNANFPSYSEEIVSSEEGVALFKSVPSGEYIVKAGHDGYSEKIRERAVYEDDETVVMRLEKEQFKAKIPLGVWIENGIEVIRGGKVLTDEDGNPILDENGEKKLTFGLSTITKPISKVVEEMLRAAEDFFLLNYDFVPQPVKDFFPLVLILIITYAAYRVAGWREGLFALIGLLLIWNLGWWEKTIMTLILVISSTLVSIVLGIPLGIIAALKEPFYRFITPILDFMQTMPAFVYLIPAILFLGVGSVPAIFAIVIFSIPPAIRLTALGIRQVNPEMLEASESFGSTTMQKLTKVQIPLAMPTILAGINQTIMLSLSMVVIAAMIGAEGLGERVLFAIGQLQIGLGFETGIAVVIVAMLLDRITQSLADPPGKKRAK